MPINLSSLNLIEHTQTIVGIATIILLGLVGYYLLRRGLDRLYQKNYISYALQSVLGIIFRWVLIALVVLLTLQQVGIAVGSIWAALSAGVVLLGVGFVAIWSVISNVLCSLLLLLFRPFRIGDEVEIIEPTGGSGLRGKVVNLNMLFTFLEERPDNNGSSSARGLVQVPNNIFFQKSFRRWQGVNTSKLDDFMFREYEPESQSDRVAV